MKLVRLSQDVSIEDPQDVSFYLVFTSGGKEVRVKVSEEDANAVLGSVLGSPKDETEDDLPVRKVAATPVEEGATVFGEPGYTSGAELNDEYSDEDDTSRFEEEQSI